VKEEQRQFGELLQNITSLAMNCSKGLLSCKCPALWAPGIACT